MTYPNLEYEKELWKKGFAVIGIDEVGRGAFAGPLYVGGVVFHPRSNIKYLEGLGINDSKKLKPNVRKLLAKIIQKESLAYHISTISVAQINRFGIGKSTFCAMRSVVRNLVRNSQLSMVNGQLLKPYVLVDGFSINHLRGIGRSNQKAIVGGDGISLSIAAASIIAKVERDRYMKSITKEYPQYKFGKNKGYGTLFHRKILQKYGPTSFHRLDFVENYI